VKLFSKTVITEVGAGGGFAIATLRKGWNKSKWFINFYKIQLKE